MALAARIAAVGWVIPATETPLATTCCYVVVDGWLLFLARSIIASPNKSSRYDSNGPFLNRQSVEWLVASRVGNHAKNDLSSILPDSLGIGKFNCPEDGYVSENSPH
jgi:hypothetical protein